MTIHLPVDPSSDALLSLSVKWKTYFMCCPELSGRLHVSIEIRCWRDAHDHLESGVQDGLKTLTSIDTTYPKEDAHEYMQTQVR